MIRRPPRSTRTDTLFPYTTLFRSCILTLTIIHSSRTTDGFRPIRIVVDGGTLQARIEQLVSVSSTRYRASTSDLSTWWSSTALRNLILREASRLDAFSGYPVHT